MEKLINKLNNESIPWNEDVFTEIRKTFHANPELSGQERKTAAVVVKILEIFQPDQIIQGIGGHGVAALYKGQNKGFSVLCRAELDALPIFEINDFSHASKNEISHKCGHDGHLTILLSLAQKLHLNPIKTGQVILLFQPAEETGEGAQRILDDEKFKSLTPDFVFALHNLPGFPMGQIILKSGTFTASVKSLVVRLKGVTSHASEPEKGINPALAISEIIASMDSFQKAESEFLLITPIHSFFGEKAYGTSPGHGETHWTVRTWKTEN